MKPAIEVELKLSLLEVELEPQNYFGVERVSRAESAVVIDLEKQPSESLIEVLEFDLEMESLLAP